jgi:DNA-binding CsgD family transcriptional regulator
MSYNPLAPAAILLPRSCARCGSVFGAAGREYFCPVCRKPHPRQKRKAHTTELSVRELQIVALVKRALPNKLIAFELHLTEGTIKEYLHHIFRKLRVSNRTELALRPAASIPADIHPLVRHDDLPLLGVDQ